MIPLKAFSVAALATAVAAGPAAAHSVRDLQGEMRERETYFEAQDRAAPDFELLDAEGDPVRLSDLRGKVVVLNFVYAGCPDVCPLHAERIADAQAMVNATPMKDMVQFVTITTDPVCDTPEVLRAYGPTHGLESANWQFLTSGPEKPTATRRIAEQYGLKFTETPDGQQMHGVVTHVIGKEGGLSARFHGLQFESTNLLLYVNALTNEHEHPEGPGPWWKLWDLF